MTEKQIKERIKKLDGAMSQEGMPLTDELKEIMEKCLKGETTTEKERKKLIEYYRRIYG